LHIQVCGFIALYLHLAELSRKTCFAQASVQLGSPKHLTWQRLTPVAASMGFAMYMASDLHHEYLPNPMTSQFWISEQELPEFGTMTRLLYSNAQHVLARVADMYAQPGDLDMTEILAGSAHVLQQLAELGTHAAEFNPSVTASYPAFVDSWVFEERRQQMEEGLNQKSRSYSQLLNRLLGLTSLVQPCDGSTKAVLTTTILIAMELQAATRSLRGSLHTPLPPALRLEPGLPVEREPEQVHNQDNSSELLPWQQEYLDALLTFSPTSILHASPPPPSDPGPYIFALPRPVEQPSAGSARPWFDRVQLPPPPPAGAPAQEVAAYLSESKAQLGLSFHALAPVAAAISHRPEPWVSEGWAAALTGLHSAPISGMQHYGCTGECQ
jgi:hypothetical protein